MRRAFALVSIVALSLLIYGGGKPSKGTPADKRLGTNKPAPSKPATQKPMQPPMPPKKGK